MADFKAPDVNAYTVEWGPPRTSDASTLGAMGICDFVEHLEKFGQTFNRIGKACDFSASGQRYAAERSAKGKGKGKDFKGKGKDNVAPASKDEEGFTLVDNGPMPGKSAGRGRGFGGRSKGRGKGLAVNYQEGILGQKQRNIQQDNHQKGKGKQKGKGGNQRRQVPSFKEWSVQTKPDWEVMREVPLSTLAKLQLNAADVTYEDLVWCGRLHNYDRRFDRITVKTERPLKRFEDLSFFNVTTSDDDILTEAVRSNSDVTVIATDHVLACIIAASRSVYSWDVVVTKIDGKLIFDKRDRSQIDFLSVNETADQPPNADDPKSMNSPIKLGQEATCINQNFSQIVLDPSDAQEMEQPNPFEDDSEDAAASGAYRYRKITLPGNSAGDSEFEQAPVTMVVRTEVNCTMPGGGLISVKALNEYDPKPHSSWRAALESQRGACLATELKNNAFKLCRWTASAILAGCDTMKMGYVSRQHPGDPWAHTILGVQTHLTDNFAEQIGLTRNNLYGILRTIIDTVMAWPDGKYLMLKDPTKSIMRLYEVPFDSFGDEDMGDDEGDDDDDGAEVDEDGNAIVPQ